MNSTDAEVISSYPGTVEGAVNVDIKAQVTGYLDHIYIREGDYVQKGQPLFKIKSDVFNEQVNNANAGLRSALAAQASARLEIEKLRPLVEGKVISDMQLRSAETSYEAARAQVAQARASLGSSRINADFTLIKAPVSGYIGRIPNRVGNLVTPADAAPLTSLSDISNVFVYFSMSEADFIAFQRSRAVESADIEFIMADGSSYARKGKLESASGNIDRTTGSMVMKAVFSNPEKLLRSGGAGKIVIHSLLPGVLKLPMAAVRDIQDRLFVFKLADSNKVVMTPVKVAGTSGNTYLVRSGVASGDKIAVNRIDVLSEGAVVQPKQVTLKSLSN